MPDRPLPRPGAPRLAPGRELPPYAYLPGAGLPHPNRDPEGHRYGRDDAEFGPVPTDRDFATHETYLHVLDLFNHGYYWEAHEGCEKWWRELAADDPRRAFFQGLVMLAAAGVKALERRPAGVRRHAARAAEHFDAAARSSAGAGSLLGLDLAELAQESRRLAEDAPRAEPQALDAPPRRRAGATRDVAAVLAIRLTPRSE